MRMTMAYLNKKPMNLNIRMTAIMPPAPIASLFQFILIEFVRQSYG